MLLVEMLAFSTLVALKQENEKKRKRVIKKVVILLHNVIDSCVH